MVNVFNIFCNFTAINKKRLEEEKKLNQGLEKYTVIQREHIHRKEEVSKNNPNKYYSLGLHGLKELYKKNIYSYQKTKFSKDKQNYEEIKSSAK